MRRLLRWALSTAIALSSCVRPLPSMEPLGGTTSSRSKPAPRMARTEVANAGDGGVARAGSDGGGTPGSREAKEAPPADQGETAVPGKEQPSTEESGASPTAGEYRGEDVATYDLQGLPERVERDPGARTRADSRGGTSWDLTIVDSSNGNDLCTLHGAAQGTTVTIAPGEDCFGSPSSGEGEGGGTSAAGTVRKGTAVFDGDHLLLDVELDFKLQTPAAEFRGTLRYHFEGRRR